jgi:hypothetical protein
MRRRVMSKKRKFKSKMKTRTNRRAVKWSARLPSLTLIIAIRNNECRTRRSESINQLIN